VKDLALLAVPPEERSINVRNVAKSTVHHVREGIVLHVDMRLGPN